MKKFSYTTTSLALVALSVLLPAPDAQAQSRGNKTYSVMTYNIGGKPGYTGYSLDNGSSCEERASQIGRRILNMPEQPDILIFTEATGDCYKDGLVEKLNLNGGPYKSFIYDMGAGSPKVQDSGLMFFSKFPWALADGTNLCPEMTFVGEKINPVGEATVGRVEGIFHGYSDLAQSDRFMEKGIGFACVHNPTTRQVINVFFTHNQANYWNPVDDDIDEFEHEVRQVNMREASAFIELHAPSIITRAFGQAVIFAGDMNVFGNDVEYWVNQGDGAEHGAVREIERVVTPADVDGFQEYADMIAPGGLLSTDNGLRDPWRLEGTAFPAMSVFDGWGVTDDMGFTYDPTAVNTTDMGFTWDAVRNGQTDGDQSRARLDYILDRQVLFNDAENCYQHMIVERGFTYTPNSEVEPAYVGMDLSDHYPLRAVIGPSESQCSPSRASLNVLGTTNLNVMNGGAKKWMFYTEPGTYVIDAGTASALEVRVFAASDLSTDLVPKEGDTTVQPGGLARERRVNDPVTFKVSGPFFVMVAYKDRGMTGPFTLKVQKNNCATPAQAEWLNPFEAVHMGMAGAPVGSLQDKCYFKIKQDEALRFGQPVEVQALVANALNHDGTAGDPKLSLLTSTQALILAGTSSSGSAKLGTPLSQSNDVRFLLLERSTSVQQMTFDLVWTRNVTTVDVTKFTVVNQDDDNAGDEVKIFWSIEDASNDVGPLDPDSTTANGQAGTFMTYFYDGLASGATSSTPLVECFLFCPLQAGFTNPHHVNIAFPDALWGIAWEIDDGTPDDALFRDGLNGSTDGRFKIVALDPDPLNWIGVGDLEQGVKIFSKNLWSDFDTYSHGYRLDAMLKLF